MGSNGSGRSGAEKPSYRWSAEEFVEAFRTHRSLTAAAKEVGISRTTAWQRRQDDPDFDEMVEAVNDEITDRLEQEAYRRAIDGVVEPKAVAGQVREIRRYSDRLLEMLLRARKPDVYRERLSIDDERENREKKALDAASDEELDRNLTGFDNVTQIRKAS